MPAPRIALIHAMPLAIEPVAQVFHELWPSARITHLLDDSLPADLTAAGGITPRCHALMLGQFSMARAAAGIAPVSGRRVLTSPHSAVARLKQLFADR
jgi:hypothetical protein